MICQICNCEFPDVEKRVIYGGDTVLFYDNEDMGADIHCDIAYQRICPICFKLVENFMIELYHKKSVNGIGKVPSEFAIETSLELFATEFIKTIMSLYNRGIPLSKEKLREVSMQLLTNFKPS